MNISWQITDSDIKKVQQVLIENENPFLKKRRERNVEKKKIKINEDTVIKTMSMCLLTSQQRSGPKSKVGKFLLLQPFPISQNNLDNIDDKEGFIKETLRENGLTRYINKISRFYVSNLRIIEDSDWKILEDLKSLLDQDSKIEERKVADKLSKNFKGFGPKQSRNFLQALGLTKYEIPIDSRIIKWLNEFGFPVTLTSSALGDKGYYHFVSDGIQELCKKANIYPCLLDAAIFSSFDDGAWSEKNVRF